MDAGTWLLRPVLPGARYGDGGGGGDAVAGADATRDDMPRRLSTVAAVDCSQWRCYSDWYLRNY